MAGQPYSTFDFTDALPDSYVFEASDNSGAVAPVVLGPGKAIVGKFRRGPFVPTKVYSWGEFISLYGGYWSTNIAPEHVRGFYEGAQNELKGALTIMRIGHLTDLTDPTTLDAVKATATVHDETGTVATVTGSQAGPFDIVLTTADTLILKVNEGTDITVTLTAGTGVSANTVALAINAALVTAGEDDNLVVTVGTGTDLNKLIFTHTQWGATNSFRIAAGSDAALLTELGLTAAQTSGTDGTDRLTISAIDEGVWGNSLSVVLAYNADNTLNITISGDQKTENFNNLEIIDSTDPVLAAKYFLRSVNNGDRSTGSTEIRIALLGSITSATSNTRPRAGTYALTSGAEGTTPIIDDFVGSSEGGTGMYALDGVAEPTDFICPEMETNYTFVATALTFGENTLKRFFVFSFAKSIGYTTAISDRNTQAWNRSRGAAYWLQVKASWNDHKDLSGSGLVLGLYAYNDRIRGVWNSPSGVDMKIPSVDKVYTLPTAFQGGKLNGASICYAFNVPGSGICLWGGRTLYKGLKWRYIVSVRDFMVIEHNLRVDGLSAVHKNNDEVLWGSLYRSAKALLQDWYDRGGMGGGSVSSAYYVKCDADTNPKNVTDNGIVRRFVRVRVPKIAEFVVTIIDQEVS